MKRHKREEQLEQLALLQAVLLAAEMDVDTALSLLADIRSRKEQEHLDLYRKLGPIGMALVDELMDGLVGGEPGRTHPRGGVEGGAPVF